MGSRLESLKALLSQGKLSTQEELRAELERQGYEVTQSTVSRDLRRLGAVRATGPDGQTVYRLGDEVVTPPPASENLGALITRIQDNGMMIVIHTSPGSASFVARKLDYAKPGGLIGTIAGDDTIFVAPPSTSGIRSCIKAIREALL